MKRFFRGALKLVGLFLLATFALAFVYNFTAGPPKSQTAEEKSAAAAQEAAEKQARAEQERKAELAKAQEDRRFQFTVLLAKAIKDAARDPDSLVWEDISANDDASVVCFKFRAKNGFGGMNREVAAFANGKMSQTAGAWNKNCAGKTMNDLIAVKHAL